MWIEIIMLSVLLSLCVIASVSDIQNGIVRNKTILLFFAISLALNIIAFVIYAPDRFLSFLVNIAMISLISMVLYGLGVWAGGDVKFSICAATLYPSGFYLHEDRVKYNLPLVLALAFAVGFFYLIFETFKDIVSDKEQKQIIKKNDVLGFLKSYLVLMCHSYLFSELFTLINIHTSKDLSILVLPIAFLIAYYSDKIPFLYKISYLLPLLAVNVTITFLTKQINLSKDIYTYVLIFLFALIRIAVSKFNYKEIKTDDVRKGMVLSAPTVMLFMNSKVKGLPLYTTEDLRSRLSQEEADAVIRWKKSKYGQPTVYIVRKIPFIIFISIGFILYFLGSCVLN